MEKVVGVPDGVSVVKQHGGLISREVSVVSVKVNDAKLNDVDPNFPLPVPVSVMVSGFPRTSAAESIARTNNRDIIFIFLQLGASADSCPTWPLAWVTVNGG